MIKENKFLQEYAKENKGLQEYGNESISSLKGADRVRMRPAVIFGSDGLDGCQHAFFEILSNSIDEAREGYGKEIKITRFKDMSLQVEDFGRGIPLDWNKNEERYNWELVFCELYAGGKYNTIDGENYEFSLGLNGLGACATQYACEKFHVEVWRDSFKYSLDFSKGENIGGLTKDEYNGRRTGTLQRFLLDREVFTDIDIPLNFFYECLKRQAVVNPGINFYFKDEISGESKTFYYEQGIKAYIEEIDAMNGLLKEPVYFESQASGKDREDKPVYKVRASVAFTFNNENSLLEYYHNSSYLEYGGSPDRAVKNAFAYAFDKQAKQWDKYKTNESKINFVDIQDSLILVINSFSTQTSYENQTKKAINNKFIQDFLTAELKEKLELWFIENKIEAERVLEQILINKRSRETAEKQRLNVKKKLMGAVDITNRVKKFVDCRSKDLSRRELYIVEGDSALGSCKLGRDAEFQAIIAVRGKILNCLKADLNTIFKSEIITNLIKVLGCGVEINNKQNKELSSFDLSSLRWDKIIICTDADVDGYQIRTLILTMFYRLLPTLLKEGKIYIAESPLFEITVKDTKNNKNAQNNSVTFFAYNEHEKNMIVEENSGKKISIQRSKGLGENEPDMMWHTTMNPETRRLIQVMIEDEQKMSEYFDLLLGDNLQGRKEFIEEKGYRYMEMIDIS